MEPNAVWLYTPRGGYGYTRRVPVVIVQRTDKRVRIMALKRTGEIVWRWVKPENVLEGITS